MKGGRSILTQEDRINDALNGNYTPLVNAIIREDINEVMHVLQTGANANQRDTRYNWCPLKWATFIYYYGSNHDPNTYREIRRSLNNANPPGRDCFDEYHIEEDSYNFSPVILDIDEQLERIRREDEEDEEENTSNRINMAGGRRRKKSRKSRKSRKHKKSYKKAKKSTTKRRKYINK